MLLEVKVFIPFQNTSNDMKRNVYWNFLFITLSLSLDQNSLEIIWLVLYGKMCFFKYDTQKILQIIVEFSEEVKHTQN